MQGTGNTYTIRGYFFSKGVVKAVGVLNNLICVSDWFVCYLIYFDPIGKNWGTPRGGLRLLVNTL